MAAGRPSFPRRLFIAACLLVSRVNTSSSSLDMQLVDSGSSSLHQKDMASSSSLEQEAAVGRLEQDSSSSKVEQETMSSSSLEQDSMSSSLEQDSLSSSSSSLEQDIRDQIVADLGLGRLPDIARVGTLFYIFFYMLNFVFI